MNTLILAAEGVTIPTGLLVGLIIVAITGLISLSAWLTKQMLELSRQNVMLATRLEHQTTLVEQLTSRVEALVAQVRQLEIYGMQWAPKKKGSD
jgi:cell division protein FtsB